MRRKFVNNTLYTVEYKLQVFTKQNNTICKNQISFQQKRRTTDHILTFKTLINKHIKGKSKQKSLRLL